MVLVSLCHPSHFFMRNGPIYSFSKEVLIFSILLIINQLPVFPLITASPALSAPDKITWDETSISFSWSFTPAKDSEFWFGDSWTCPDLIPVQQSFKIKALFQNWSWCMEQSVKIFSFVLTQVLESKIYFYWKRQFFVLLLGRAGIYGCEITSANAWWILWNLNS